MARRGNQVHPSVKALLYVFRAPMVLDPPGYAVDVPKSLIDMLIPSRILCVLSGDFEDGMTSVVDTVIHLWSVSMNRPMPPSYVKVYYMYVKQLFGDKMPDIGIRDDEITDEIRSLGRELRRKILRKQLKAIEKMRKTDAEIRELEQLFTRIVNKLEEKEPK